MKTVIRQLCFLLFFSGCLILWSDVAAQLTSGYIKGQVTDKDGNALPGASILIKGTTRGISTDLTGTFTLLDLKEGKYILVVNYMGYSPVESNVLVKASETVNLNIKLINYAANLGSVTVMSSREGQQKALNMQRTADNFKQVISIDQIGRFPDLNISEALQRLPGVTISRDRGEGAMVQLRGTPGNYTNININGEQLMGLEESGVRNADLSVVPVNLVSSMEVIKTLTPDLDGDAIAGIINMNSPKAVKLKPTLSVDLGLGYNNLRSNLNNISTLTYGQRFFKSTGIPNGKLGVMVSGSYYKSVNGRDRIEAQYWKTAMISGTSTVFPTDFRYRFENDTRTRKGLTATVDYVFNAKSSLTANVIYSDRHDDNIRYRKRWKMPADTKMVYNISDSSFSTSKGKVYNEVLNEDQDEKYTAYSLNGQTIIVKALIDGGLFFTQSNRSYYGDNASFITGNATLKNYDITTDNLKAKGSYETPSLYNFSTYEANYNSSKGQSFVARINMTIPYQIGENSAIFKVGVKEKRMENNRFKPNSAYTSNYTGAAAAGSLSNFTGSSEVSGNFMDNGADFGFGVSPSAINYVFNNPTSFTKNTDVTRINNDSYYYEALENVTSGYLMTKINFKKWMVLGGVRMESTQGTYNANSVVQGYNATSGLSTWVSTSPLSSKENYTKFLPNLQVKYDISKSSLLRAAMTYGYSRANFADLCPLRVIDVSNGVVTVGNPALLPAFSSNYDVAYEKYLKSLGIISVGFYYKHINAFQYISQSFVTGTEFTGGAPYIGYQYNQTLNGDAAHVYGMELNLQTNLTYLPGLLKGFSVAANYTYTHSKGEAQGRTGIKLPGQADNTGNASLTYGYKNFSIQGNLNYNGSYIMSLGGASDGSQDVILDNRVQIDANTSYKIKRFVIYAEVLNLTNSPQVEYYGMRSRIYQKEYYSWWGHAGIKYRL